MRLGAAPRLLNAKSLTGFRQASMTQLYFVRPPHLRVMWAPSATPRRATRNPTSRRVASYNARPSGEQKTTIRAHDQGATVLAQPGARPGH
jgi:hypothetical protein